MSTYGTDQPLRPIRTATVPERFGFPVGGHFELTIPVAVSFNMATAGLDVVLVIRERPGGEIRFRADLAGDYIAISGQTITIDVPPDAESDQEVAEGVDPPLLSDLWAAASTRRYAYSVSIFSSAEKLLFRLQGDADFLESEGELEDLGIYP